MAKSFEIDFTAEDLTSMGLKVQELEGGGFHISGNPKDALRQGEIVLSNLFVATDGVFFTREGDKERLTPRPVYFGRGDTAWFDRVLDYVLIRRLNGWAKEGLMVNIDQWSEYVAPEAFLPLSGKEFVIVTGSGGDWFVPVSTLPDDPRQTWVNPYDIPALYLTIAGLLGELREA